MHARALVLPLTFCRVSLCVRRLVSACFARRSFITFITLSFFIAFGLPFPFFAAIGP